ncbi:unnamed protein product, partial [Effrenium voratum]
YVTHKIKSCLGMELSPAQLAALRDLYSRHGRIGDDGTSELNFEEFRALAQSLQLPVAQLPESAQREVFAELAASGAGPRETASFEEFCRWTAEGSGADALALLEASQSDAALSAGAARLLTTLLRPLGGVAFLQGLVALKLKGLWLAKASLLAA